MTGNNNADAGRTWRKFGASQPKTETLIRVRRTTCNCAVCTCADVFRTQPVRAAPSAGTIAAAESCVPAFRQLTADLKRYDQLRHEEFKQYEMEKEFKYQEGLRAMDEEHKKDAIKKHEEEQKKKKEHPKVRT